VDLGGHNTNRFSVVVGEVITLGSSRSREPRTAP
jgi:hypothetical protein